ncbi:hypothetical protein AGLY_001889 [Aphis glycines]|uniref:Uncharacterized protein n=1 Tax=Aphis glycines TaxID=307491 RepID=A0A6G0U462_APHGL|nr:hypothetical protein AGLY_001889 [Aphis glycines]
MYPQTPGVIFWQIVEYLNMMMVIISPIIIVWSIVKIALKLLENKKTKLIEDKDFEEKPLEELIKEVEADCLDDHSSSENNSNGDGDRTCSDSDLSVPPTDTIRKYKESSILDQSNSDCFKTYLSLSGIIKDADTRNSSNSAKQCFSSSSEEETEQYSHVFNNDDVFISKGQSLTRIPKKEIMRVFQETENSEQLKDTGLILETT